MEKSNRAAAAAPSPAFGILGRTARTEINLAESRKLAWRVNPLKLGRWPAALNRGIAGTVAILRDYSESATQRQVKLWLTSVAAPRPGLPALGPGEMGASHPGNSAGLNASWPIKTWEGPARSS